MSQSILYKIPLIKQALQECAQTSAVQLLNYYGINKTLNEVRKEVPVYIKDGVPLGSSVGHIATYLLQQGFEATMHIVELEIFDQTWRAATSDELIELLNNRKKFAKHHRYDTETMEVIFDGYVSFLTHGGKIVFPVIDEQYLVKLLKEGPIYGVLSWNFLNAAAKVRFDKEKNDSEKDAIEGHPATHALIISGYRDGKFLLTDPDYMYGGERWVESGLLVGSIYLAQTDFDSMVITFTK